MTRRSFLSAVRNAVVVVGLSPMLGPLIERDRDAFDLMKQASKILQETYIPSLISMLNDDPLLKQRIERAQR